MKFSRGQAGLDKTEKDKIYGRSLAPAWHPADTDLIARALTPSKLTVVIGRSPDGVMIFPFEGWPKLITINRSSKGTK